MATSAAQASRYVHAPPQASTATLLGPDGQESLHVIAIRGLAIIAVIGSLMVNLFLCFVNTKVMGISQTHLMLAELMMMAAAMLGAMDRRLGLYLILTVFFSYMVFLFAMRQETDLKGLRDIVIPIAFYFLGTRLRDPRLADRLVTASAIIVLFFGLFEYLLTDLYLEFFNILGYYLARGSATTEETFGATKGLFGSGTRPEPRTLLPFLGQHRVSSVFLEPVSAGNFGVIVYCWTLLRHQMRRRFVVMALAIVTIVLADARFGFYTCVLVTILTPFFRFMPRVVWLVAPFLILALISAYGMLSGTQGGANDIAGRFNVTAHLLTQLTPSIVFGTASTNGFTADSGLAYTLTKFGLGGFVFLWAAVVYAPIRDRHAWRFHAAMMVYLLLLMLISNSFYSIKTAALMWFLLGTADQAAGIGERISAPAPGRRTRSPKNP